MAQIRLDKLLSNRTPYSRSDVKNILKKGAVQVDGIAECDGSQKVDPDMQVVTCYGKKLPGQTHTYFLVNKPTGYVCATRDATYPTVEELLPKALRVKGLFPAGRLDADSTGLVLLTDDGDLAHRMLAPKSHVPKYYLVRLKKPFQPSYERRLSKGIVLSDGTVCLPAQARKLETAGSYALICLHEGKYHQVKRMFAAVNNHVEMLHRVAVGGLVLPENMPVGGYLEMLHKDVETMLKSGTFEDIYERTMTCFSSYLINAEQ